jgi:hypothetical protein
MKPGHRNGPEPPTLITMGPGKVFLGGIPKKEDAEWFEATNVTLCITCFAKSAASQGGFVPPSVLNMNVEVSHEGRRAQMWSDAWKVIMCTFQAGESVLIHCMGGVHRAPVVAAVAHSKLMQVPLTAAVEHIERLRAVEFAKVRMHHSNRGGKQTIMEWAAEESQMKAKVAPMSTDNAILLHESMMRRRMFLHV